MAGVDSNSLTGNAFFRRGGSVVSGGVVRFSDFGVRGRGQMSGGYNVLLVTAVDWFETRVVIHLFRPLGARVPESRERRLAARRSVVQAVLSIRHSALSHEVVAKCTAILSAFSNDLR